MATPKLQIDNSKLLKRMKRYEEITGKQIGATMRRGARLLAVNMATSTQPYSGGSKKATAEKLGRQAVQNDILRVYTPGTDVQFPVETTKLSFKSQIEKMITKNVALRDAILGALGYAASRSRSKKGVLKQKAGLDRLNSILQNVPSMSKLHATQGVDPSIHRKTRNAYGRVRRGWKGREIVANGRDLVSYIKERQARVGMTKAAWAAAALQVNADVKDALSGIPAWVKRHVGKVPAAVVDNAESLAPKITLTNKLHWADKALRGPDMKEAIRISREKFYRSMGREIREALKAEKVA